MKQTRLVNQLVALLFLMGASLGCEKSTPSSQPPALVSLPTKSDADIEQLVARAFQKGTPAEYDAITLAYQALSADQLVVFNQFRLKTEQKKIEQQLAQSGARLSKQQLALAAQVVEQISTFRSAINQQSIQHYGVPYNQLADSLVNHLLEQQTVPDAPAMTDLETLTDPNARLNQPSACSSASFLLIARKVSNGSRGWSGWTQRRTPNTSDCDYEYRYSDYRINFDPKDWFADRLCNSFNNALLRRYATGYTRLLFGNRGVWVWIGYPGVLSVDMANY